MKTKNHSALFAFVAAFAFSAFIANFVKIEQGAVVVWNETKAAEKITRVLAQDIANGKDRQLNEDYAITTLAYVDNSENIDDANLPADFQRAWRIHMKAWRNHSNFLIDGRNYKSEAKMKRRWLKNTDEINRTWLKVLQIARKHNAEIPAGAID